ncbi:hypothetical protein BOX15_Mlig002714g2 [Macrostomum lignano]|uniref:RNA helicase n=2 Tax=Macrostomum lignano TaxID=282301 RepID=A0A267FKL5_9PLAT|nr:hypothetical protein BOX15_Mlig002714g2 [Macrostomum lignano]
MIRSKSGWKWDNPSPSSNASQPVPRPVQKARSPDLLFGNLSNNISAKGTLDMFMENQKCQRGKFHVIALCLASNASEHLCKSREAVCTKVSMIEGCTASSIEFFEYSQSTTVGRIYASNIDMARCIEGSLKCFLKTKCNWPSMDAAITMALNVSVDAATLARLIADANKQAVQKIDAAEKRVTRQLATKLRQILDNDEFAGDKVEEITRATKVFERDCHECKVKLKYLDSGDEGTVENIHQIVGSLQQSERQSLLGLPIYPYKEEIVNLVLDNQVSVFVAETGSGKSTQIVQYLQTSGLFPGKIACTQPRRLAARSLSEYVAKQMNCKNGSLVASMVGGKPVKEETKIVFMTDFQLLKLCVSDPRLSEYNCIVVDEAHERNLHTDLIIGLLKQALKLRPELKVLITSATINPHLFLSFFDDFSKAHAKIPGRVYRVDVQYSDKKMDKSEKYFETAVDKVVELCLDRNVPHGNMLVFLTTPKDTENASALFQRKIGTQSKIPSYPLHGQLQPEDQQLAMEEVKDKNSRKVIFATNCAETSLTIPGVVVVVDSGLSKQNAFDPVRNMDALVVGEISRNSADQRKGRAGRTQNGCCYRLYTQAEYEAMSESTVPEIQRIDLSGVAIRILELGLNPLEFDYLTPPSRQGLNSAMSALEFIGAFSEGQLTELGKKIAKIPAEPRLAKMILLLCENNLAMEGMVLASLITLSGQVFFRGKTDAERQDATKTKEFYASDDGDLLTSMQVFKDWRSRPDNLRTKWSVKNCVNNKSMRSVNEKVADLQRAIKYDLKMQVSETFSDNGNFASAVQECIYRVFSDKLCAYSGNPRIGFVEVSTGQLLKIHPSSVFSNAVNFPFAVYTKLLETEQTYLLNITPVSPEWLSDRNLTSEAIFRTVTRIMPVSTEVMKRLVGRGRVALNKLTENVKEKLKPKLFEVHCNFELHFVDIVCEPASSLAAARAMTDDFVKETVDTLCSLTSLTPDQTQLPCHIRLSPGFVISQLNLTGESSAVKLLARMPNQPISIPLLNAVATKYGHEFGEIQVNEKGKFLIAESPVVAQKLVEKLNASEVAYLAQIKPHSYSNSTDRQQTCDLNELKLRLTFPRRYPTGFANVSFDNPEDASSVLERVTSLSLNNSFWASKMALDKRDPEKLIIFDVPLWIDEDVIANELARSAVLLDSMNPRVTMRREHQDNALSKEAAGARVLEILRAVFSSEFVDDEENYQFGIRDPPNSGFFDWQVTICFRYDDDYIVFAREFKQLKGFALANLSNWSHGYPVRGRERKSIFLAKQNAYKASAFAGSKFELIFPPLIVSSEIFSASEPLLLEVKRDIEVRSSLFPTAIQNMLRVNPVSININTDYREKHRGVEVKKVKIDVDTQDVTTWSFTYQHLRKSLMPYELDCSRNDALRSLLLARSESELRKRLPELSHAIFDRRRECLSIYGTDSVKSRCQIIINNYLSEREALSLRELSLAGAHRPRSLIRRLLKTFGRDLSKLGDESVTAELDLGDSRTLTLFGVNADAVAAAAEAVERLAEEEAAAAAAAAALNATTVAVPGTVKLECPVCFAPAGTEAATTLALCGHVYCTDCLDLQLASTTDVPLLCAAEGCGRPFHVAQDILDRAPSPAEREQLMRRLLGPALKSHVNLPASCLQFCPAPDCPGLLRDFKEAAVRESRCKVCRGTFCLDCQYFSHVGLTCETAKEIRANPDYGLQVCSDWLQQLLLVACLAFEAFRVVHRVCFDRLTLLQALRWADTKTEFMTKL